MLNFPKSDYPKPPEHLIVALAKKLPSAIVRNYKPGIEPGEYRTRFYNVSELVQLLIETGDDPPVPVKVHRFSRPLQ